MFKSLHNEAVYKFQLRTVSPFIIKSGEENPLDPTAPRGQLMRSYHQGQRQVVIPGSTLKGIFRSRAEQLLRTMGCKVEGNPISLDGDETASHIYHKKSNPAERLFGSTAMRGRILFFDAFPVPESQVLEGLRHMVGINRVTGGAASGKKFDTEVVEEALFQVEVRLVNYELKQLALIAWLLLDLHEGFMKIGSFTTRGFGRFEVDDVSLQIHEYRQRVEKITGYDESDCLERKVNWEPLLLKKVAKIEGLDRLIGSGGLFEQIPMEFSTS